MSWTGWDYEESTVNHYHIYTMNGPLDGLIDTFTIEIPQTPENDADVEIIVQAIDRMAARLEGAANAPAPADLPWKCEGRFVGSPSYQTDPPMIGQLNVAQREGWSWTQATWKDYALWLKEKA